MYINKTQVHHFVLIKSCKNTIAVKHTYITSFNNAQLVPLCSYSSWSDTYQTAGWLVNMDPLREKLLLILQLNSSVLCKVKCVSKDKRQNLQAWWNVMHMHQLKLLHMHLSLITGPFTHIESTAQFGICLGCTWLCQFYTSKPLFYIYSSSPSSHLVHALFAISNYFFTKLFANDSQCTYCVNNCFSSYIPPMCCYCTHIDLTYGSKGINYKI